MKLFFLALSLLCIHTASPVKIEKNQVAKKQAAATYKMLPSILIVATY